MNMSPEYVRACAGRGANSSRIPVPYCPAAVQSLRHRSRRSAGLPHHKSAKLITILSHFTLANIRFWIKKLKANQLSVGNKTKAVVNSCVGKQRDQGGIASWSRKCCPLHLRPVFDQIQQVKGEKNE